MEARGLVKGLAGGIAFGVSSGAFSSAFNPARKKYNGSKSFSVAAQETGLSGFDFNADGTQITLTGSSSDSAKTYTGTTWADLSGATYDAAKSSSYGSGSTNPTGNIFLASGTKICMTSRLNDSFATYTLTTPYNPGAKAYQAGQSASVSAQQGDPTGLGITQDGMFMAMVGANNIIYGYDLSSANNPGTRTYNAAKNFNMTAFCGLAESVRFINNDTAIIVADSTNKMIHYIELATAGNPATGTYSADKSLYVGNVISSPTDAAFDPTGTYMYVAGNATSKVHFFGPAIDLSENLGVLFLGDSLLNDLFTTPGEATLVAALDDEYAYVDIYDMAIGGTALYTSGGTAALVDSDTMTISTAYTAQVGTILVPEIAQMVCLSIGTNGNAATGSDPDTYFEALDVVLADLRSRFANLQKVLILGWNRHTGVTDAQWQAARVTKIIELTHDPLITRGPELYDLATDDVEDIHPNATGYGVLAGRLTARILAALGKTAGAGTVGPEVTSVTYSGSTVTAYITHDGGSSLTGTEYANFKVFDDGVAATISGVTVNTDNLVFTLSAPIASASVVEFWPVWGRGAWTEANIIRDNNGLPIVTTAALSASEV